MLKVRNGKAQSHSLTHATHTSPQTHLLTHAPTRRRRRRQQQKSVLCLALPNFAFAIALPYLAEVFDADDGDLVPYGGEGDLGGAQAAEQRRDENDVHAEARVARRAEVLAHLLRLGATFNNRGHADRHREKRTRKGEEEDKENKRVSLNDLEAARFKGND